MTIALQVAMSLTPTFARPSFGYAVNYDKPGWTEINNKWYFLKRDGLKYTGLQQIDGKTYYFDSDGVMQTGAVTIEGTNVPFQ